MVFRRGQSIPASAGLVFGLIAIGANPPGAAKSRHTLRHRFIAGVAGLALIGGTAACGPITDNGSTSESADDRTPVDTANPSPNDDPSNPEDLVDVTVLPENVVTHGMFGLLKRDEQIRLKALDAMSLDEFRALPEEEQFKFAEFVYRNNLPILEHRMRENGDAAEFVNEDPNSPEGILKSQELIFALQMTLVELDPELGVRFDAVTAKKLNVLATSQQNSVEQRFSLRDSLIDKKTLSVPYLLLPNEAIGSKTNGESSLLINIVDTSTGAEYQSIFSKYTFSTIDGTDQTLYRSDLEITKDDPRYIQF